MSGRKAREARARVQRQQRSASAATLTAQQLREGISGPGPYSLRLAKPGDSEAVIRLAELAGAEPPRFLGEAIEDQTIGEYTLRSLERPNGGGIALAPHLSAQDPQRIHIAGTTVLVATHPDCAAPVAACVFSPPSNLLHRYEEMGLLTDEVLLMTLLGVRKLDAIAVEREHREHGLGRNLLRRSTGLIFTTQIMTIFGEIRTSDRLDEWYRKNGYTVFAPDQALDLTWLYNQVTGVGPMPGEQLIAAMPDGKRPRSRPA